MAHFIVEYSANLDENRLDLNGLFAKLHRAAVKTKLLPLAGLRSRAYRCEHFYVADGASQFGFVHLEFKLSSGRCPEKKQLIADALFATLTDHLQHIYDTQGLAISFEMSELPAIKANKNNLRDYLTDGDCFKPTDTGRKSLC